MNTPNADTTDTHVRTRNRWVLLGVAALFAAPILIALALNLSGWRPAGTRAYGRLIDPPRDVSATPVALADGGKLAWRNAQWQWTLLALPGANCATQCQAALGNVLRMRATLGRKAERLRVIYLGSALPADMLAALAPLQSGSDETGTFAQWRATGDDALALVLVDPSGYLMLNYAQGFDVAGIRRDLPKVIN
ncbi:MAG TPA: hypothetical protein VIE67_09430 [Rudaea sp.]|jgi:hypothetical protein|uniref:hypothetical protein n=1 Tax=Rudaea sp. TaxID=2136325 RepID=UPI002F943CA3